MSDCRNNTVVPRQNCEAGTGPEWLGKKNAQRFPTVSASRKPTPGQGTDLSRCRS